MSILRAVPALFALSTATLLLPTVSPLSAGLLPGNIWPNPTLDLDSNDAGVPDFWNLGGSDGLIDVWSTALWVSPAHSLEVNDANTNAYGEWYSDLLDINGGTTYQFRYNLYYIVTNIGPMRVSVNFYDSSSTIISGLSYTFSGDHAFWQEITQQFTAPANAVALGLTFTSGGSLNVTGQAWLDDVSLAVSTNSSSLVPYIEDFPPLPNPLVIRDWKQTASNYHQLAFNSSITGPFLPLIYQYTANTAAGYSGPAFGLPSYPTSLLYNPYAVAEKVIINVGTNASHLYDAVAGVFVATNVTGNASVTIPPDNAVVLAQCPASGVITQADRKLLVAGTVIDYRNATRDTDGDGLPDWWESLYYGNATNALPQALAANGFSNLQCYWLGLNPINPLSTFKVQGVSQPRTGYPQISWNSIGGKTYCVEYANSLAVPTAFTQAMTVTETNVPAGVESTQTFVDDYTLTGGPPGANGRYYRVTLAAP